MDERGIASVLDFYRRQALSGSENSSDCQLLSQFVEQRNEAAFESLIQRHGSMVYGVAKRVLRDSHVAEDVFQATFLILARKARSLRRRASIGGWLYRVALRTALRARPAPEKRVATERSADPATDAEWSEVRVVLDEEIDKLPDRCRLAVIACYLQGRTAEEAAQEFGCPRGTILSRLAAAREKLRRALSRRGISASVSALTAGLTSETVVAVPRSLIALALKAALPGAVIVPTIATLAQGVLTAMWMTKLKIAALSIAAVGVLGFGATHVFGPGAAVAVAPQFPAKAEKDDRTLPADADDPRVLFVNLAKGIPLIAADTPERKLMHQKLEAAQREGILRFEHHSIGRGSFDTLLDSARRIRDAGLELTAARGRITILERYEECQKRIHALNKARFDAGSIMEQDYQQSLYHYLDAQLQLMREKERKPNVGR